MEPLKMRLPRSFLSSHRLRPARRSNPFPPSKLLTQIPNKASNRQLTIIRQKKSCSSVNMMRNRSSSVLSKRLKKMKLLLRQLRKQPSDWVPSKQLRKKQRKKLPQLS